MTEQEFTELAAAYALNALTGDEREAFERALAEHPEWADHLRVDLETAALLAGGAADESPRPEVKRELLGRLDALIDAGVGPSAVRGSQPAGSAVDRAARPTPTPAPAPLPDLPEDGDDELPRRRRFGTRILATLAVVALIAGVGSGLFSALQPQRPAGIVALEQIARAPDAQSASIRVPSGGQAALTWSAQDGRAVLVTEGMDAAPSGHTYELWFVRGEEKIPAGTFDPDANGVAAVLVSGEMAAGDTIAVTVEVTGGSPDGLPSDQLVFAIPTGAQGQPT